MSSAQMPTVAFPQLGRYQIVQKLGEGGMGAVYLAQDTHLNRQVAVKILPAHSVNNPDAVGRFQREARALAQLSHPNIIQAFDVGEENGQHFLVMEYVAGQSLAAMLEKSGPLPPARAAAFIHQAALALAHAHEKGLIHRDVKPSNLLVTGDGQVKLLDLGLSRFLQDQLGDASQTREGVGMGTPDYAPPEQFRDAHNVDHRADIYSLGCTLYHLLTGRVPFPGTSLSDKYTAHATRQPTSLEELGVEAPGGLVLVLEKMMGKSPTERFQNARDVADALLPHVSTTSSSFAKFKSTASFQLGQLTMTEFPRRRRWLPWTITGVVSLAALILLALVLSNALRPGKQQVAQGNTGDTTKPDDKKPEKTPKPAVESDPNILTVSKDEKAGGQYRKIADAIGKVKPGQTIRVLDAGVYEEQLTFDERHAGVTLEAVRGATLQTSDATTMIVLDGVADFTLRGFRLRAQGVTVREQGATLVLVRGKSHGVLLERLDADTDRKGSYVAITIQSAGELTQTRPAVVVQYCTIQRAKTGLFVNGEIGSAGHTILRENLIQSPARVGISLTGDVRRVLVVGNRIIDAGSVGIYLYNCPASERKILVANNTVLHGLVSCAIGNSTLEGASVRFHNNLFLAPAAADFCYLDEDPRGGVKPRDGKKILTACSVSHNWRQTETPQESSVFARGWIPLAKDDLRHETNDGVERQLLDAKTFLRPAKDSPLATSGAGVVEPSLPRYVGAVPPESVEPWDWERTWLAWPGTTKLLTVSKDTKDRADYPTINAALKKANPWDTIRVLDGATYTETITLSDKDKHEGLCLETVGGATLQLPENELRLLTISNVPHVRVSGFHLSGKSRVGAGVAELVSISGNSSGIQLSQLHLHPGMFTRAVLCQNVVADTSGQPLCLRNCRITGAHPNSDGVLIAGTAGGKGTCGVQVADCRLSGLFRGIVVSGRLQDIQVVGNRIWKCSPVGLQTENLHPASTRVLLAGNCVFGCTEDFRNWEDEPYPEHSAAQVEFSNNLFAEATSSDARFVQCPRKRDDHGGEIMQQGDSIQLQRLWRFRRNYRDCSGIAAYNMPLAKEDHLLETTDLESTALDAPDRWRPKKTGALAKDGTGAADASLPIYIGALPPDGVEAWNWDWTWSARTPRPKLVAKEKTP